MVHDAYRPTRSAGRWACFFVVVLFSVGATWVSAHPPAEAPPVKADAPKPTATPSPTPTAAPVVVPHFPEIEKLRAKALKGEPLDEPLGGLTQKGTPVTPRTAECFPAESRDIFWEMDRVADGVGDKKFLRPLNFDKNNDGKLTDVSPHTPHPDNERDAIRGRNTWILWSGGNEGFWNWLSQDGYGLADFLVVLDSRARVGRFKRAGMINQPGFKPNHDPEKKILGLYLDVPESAGSHRYKLPPWDEGYRPGGVPANHAGFELFKPRKRDDYDKVVKQLRETLGDGVDYDVYGFATGVVGLRLFLNPDFFGDTPEAEAAQKYWDERVVKTNDRYYTDPSITADPKLVRPFRIGMSCGFCHVGPHPLNPPDDPESPAWRNLSSIIGNQYWKPQPLFGNRIGSNNFLYHFLASQQPGTIDTSLVSTDQINNSNTINAVFEVTARLQRAGYHTPPTQTPNPPERQSDANLRVASIEDQTPAILNPDGLNERLRNRHTTRVLLDGSDSIGTLGALARVYLNIGTFYEEWGLCHNPVVGFRPQRPFTFEVCQRNSVYWQTNERYRAPYLAAFFTSVYAPKKETPPPAALPAATGAKPAAPPSAPADTASADTPASAKHDSTQAMHLVDATSGDSKTASAAAKNLLKLDDAKKRIAGRQVWLDHCAICHSSKQPLGFELIFKAEPTKGSWRSEPMPESGRFVLPAHGANWEDFKKSASYIGYLEKLEMLVAEEGGDLQSDPLLGHPRFWQENYLSTDIRVPVSLVGTNPARALGANATSQHVWDNYSSDSYKQLPAVGVLSYYNVASETDERFDAPGGGRGYYRPATHVSLWSTAPFLHNNAMGLYLDDPSVQGRLVQFLDSIRRMLWVSKRASKSLVLSKEELTWLMESYSGKNPLDVTPDLIVARPGDLRQLDPALAGHDPGFVYRAPQETSLQFAAPYTRRLVDGILGGPWRTELLSLWSWIAAVITLVWVAFRKQTRYPGIALLLLAVFAAVLLAVSGLGQLSGTTIGVILLGIMDLLHFSSWMWWLLVLVVGGIGFTLIQAKPGCDDALIWILLAIAATAVAIVWFATESWWAVLITAALGAFFVWKYRPTLPIFARNLVLTVAVAIALLGYGAHRFINGQVIATVPFANVTFGPYSVVTGPIPRGVPINLIMNLDPDSENFPKAAVSLVLAVGRIKSKHLTGTEAYEFFMQEAGPPLLAASKCPDFVLDRGHLFGEALSDEEKEQLIAFLKTL